MTHPTISNQARDRGVDPSSLVGKTAGTLRDMGYFVPPQVDDAAVLDESAPGEPVVRSPERARAVVTGSSILVWRNWVGRQREREQ